MKADVRAVLAAVALAIAGCGGHPQNDANTAGDIPAQGTPAEIQQAIQQNAAREAAAAKVMPRPSGQNPAAPSPSGSPAPTGQ